MSVRKVIEIMGDSDQGWEQAAQEAVEEAAKTVKHIRSVWIKDHAATVVAARLFTPLTTSGIPDGQFAGR